LFLQDETPISELTYPPVKPGRVVTDRSAFSTVDFDILQVGSTENTIIHFIHNRKKTKF